MALFGKKDPNTSSEQEDSSSAEELALQRVKEQQKAAASVPPPTGGRGLPTSNNVRQRSLSVDDYFGDDDEESNALQQAKSSSGGEAPISRSYSKGVEGFIAEKIKQLHKQYPMGGLQSSRVITTDALMKAPANYFEQYLPVIKSVVNTVQGHLAESGKSEQVAAASNDPTNDELQEAAYRTVNALAASQMERLPYRGTEKSIILSMVLSEIIGFGPLDPLWRDERVTEILVNGPHDVQIEISGQLFRVDSCKFRDQEHLMGLLERLFGAVGKVLSKTTPLVNGRLHDMSRIYATHPAVSPEGSNFSIRRHKEQYIGPEQYLKWNALNREMLTDLGNMVYRGGSFLVTGGTGTGKTTLLNALSAFLPDRQRVLTLEDNLEMKLHPKKYRGMPMEVIPPRPDRPGDTGTSMRDLVKGAMRLRPNFIWIGEVRDEAAYELCQALVTGHSGASTLHANSEGEAIYRLVGLISQGGVMSGDSAYPLIASSFDFVVQLSRFLEDGSRRVVGISEVAPYAELGDDGRLTLKMNPLWRWVTHGLENDRIVGEWEKVGELSDLRKTKLRMDTTPPLTWDQLRQVAAL